MSGYEAFAGFYDALTENVGYKTRGDYIRGLINEHGVNGGLLLDLACGTGSLSVELARQGFEVIGVDESPAMLCEAQNKAYQNGVEILFLCQRMQALDLYGTVKAAVCTLDSLNHLIKEEDVRETFRRVSLFLEPGGVFVFDVNTVYKHRQVLGDNIFVYDTDDVYCVWQNRLDKKTDTVEITLDFFAKTEDCVYDRSGERFFERAYETGKLCEWLEQAGMKAVHIYGEMTREAPSPDAQRIYIVAEKL